MGVAALVLGIIAIVFCILPTLGVTQLVGIVLGIIALVLGIVGRKQATEQGQPTGSATAGLVLGIISLVIGGLIYASCMYCYKKIGDGVQEVGREFNKKLSSPEFKQALEKARQEHQKARREAESALKGIEKQLPAEKPQAPAEKK